MQGGWDNDDLFNPSEYNCQLHKSLVPKVFAMVFENEEVVNVVFDNHEIKTTC